MLNKGWWLISLGDGKNRVDGWVFFGVINFFVLCVCLLLL